MDDLIRFVRRDDITVLVQAAVAHAQFETIHPFSDGNGRTGRALVHAILRAKRLMVHTTAPVSAGLLTETPPESFGQPAGRGAEVWLRPSRPVRER